jgi:2-polyprenyl-3-methyl-5-hydroxy-6-metoxy-1,4-benzoquinol methylase
MSSVKCPICKSNKLLLIWNDKIREGISKLTKNKRKIYRCKNCDVAFLAKRYSSLPDDTILRKVTNKKEIMKLHLFHAKRELPKLKKILKVCDFTKKKILLVNCDFGLTILNEIKKVAKLTAGISETKNAFYLKDYLKKKKHLFFNNLKQIKSKKYKFDVIISPAQIEHVYDPIKYINNFKKIISKNGVLILRIPNHDNVYKFILNKIFLFKDYRVSHNFYFNENSCNYLFKKNKFKIIKKLGLMEHDVNNLLNYIRLGRRPMQYEKKKNGKNYLYLNKKNNKNLTKNLENSPIPSHLLYVIQPFKNF